MDDKHVTHNLLSYTLFPEHTATRIVTGRWMPSADGQSDVHFVGYTGRLSVRVPSRRRPKVTATLDPDLLASVDVYVAVHPDLDRSVVIDEALRLWRAHQLELAMAAQFASPDGADPAERHAWDQLRQTATARQLDPRHSA